MANDGSVDGKLKIMLENEFKFWKTVVLPIEVLKTAIKKSSNNLSLKQKIAGNGIVEFLNASRYFGRPLTVWPDVQWYPDGDKFEIEFREEKRIRTENLMIPVVFDFVSNVFSILDNEQTLPIKFFEFILARQFTEQLLVETVKSLETHFLNANFLYKVENGFVSLIEHRNLRKILFDINSLLRSSSKSYVGTDMYFARLDKLHAIFTAHLETLAAERIEFAFLTSFDNFKSFINFYPSIFRFEIQGQIRSVCPVLKFNPGFPLEPEHVRNAYIEWTQAFMPNDRQLDNLPVSQRYQQQKCLQASQNCQSTEPSVLPENRSFLVAPDRFTRSLIRNETPLSTNSSNSFEDELYLIKNGHVPVTQPNMLLNAARPHQNVFHRMPFSENSQSSSSPDSNSSNRFLNFVQPNLSGNVVDHPPMKPITASRLEQTKQNIVRPLLRQHLANCGSSKSDIVPLSSYCTSSEIDQNSSGVGSTLSRTRSTLSASFREDPIICSFNEDSVDSRKRTRTYSWDEDAEPNPNLPDPLKPVKSPYNV